MRYTTTFVYAGGRQVGSMPSFPLRVGCNLSTDAGELGNCVHAAYKYVRDSVPFNATQNAGEPLSKVHVVGCVRDRGRGYGAKAVV